MGGGGDVEINVDTSLLVHKSGNETINGIKTFTNEINGTTKKAKEDDEGNKFQDTYAKKNELPHVPIGSILWFGANSVPTGYLICDGSDVSRNTYSALFSVIGTKFGSGDGSTTFNLPNLIDKFIQGSLTVGNIKNAGLPNITGSFAADKYAGNNNSVVWDQKGSFYGSSTTAANPVAAYAADDLTKKQYIRTVFDASRSNSIYGSSNTVQPPAVTLLPCIKAFDDFSDVTVVNSESFISDINTRISNVSSKINNLADNNEYHLYVAPDGDNSNDGSLEHPFSTIQATIEAGRKLRGRVTAHIASGNYTLPFIIVSEMKYPIEFIGDENNRPEIRLTSSPSWGSSISVSQNCFCRFTNLNFTVDDQTDPTNCICVIEASFAILTNVNFTSVSQKRIMYVASNSTVMLSGNLSFYLPSIGSVFMFAENDSSITYYAPCSLALNGTVSNATLIAGGRSFISVPYTLTGNVTGKRYDVWFQGMIWTGGKGKYHIPGTIDGGIDSGGLAYYW